MNFYYSFRFAAMLIVISLITCTPMAQAVAITPFTPSPVPLGDAPASINDLIEGAVHFNGQRITIQGEAIGDVMYRGSYGWVNINDGTNVIGIWARRSELESIKNVGRYRVHGDILEVQGVFYRADPLHGGDLAVRADRLEIAERGGAILVPFKQARLYEAITALLGMIILAILWWYRRLHILRQGDLK